MKIILVLVIIFSHWEKTITDQLILVLIIPLWIIGNTIYVYSRKYSQNLCTLEFYAFSSSKWNPWFRKCGMHTIRRSFDSDCFPLFSFIPHSLQTLPTLAEINIEIFEGPWACSNLAEDKDCLCFWKCLEPWTSSETCRWRRSFALFRHQTQRYKQMSICCWSRNRLFYLPHLEDAGRDVIHGFDDFVTKTWEW